MTEVKDIRVPWKLPLSIAYFLSGLCGLIYQVVWIRKFCLIFGSTVFAMSVVIAVFFGGLAIGSYLFGKISTSSRNPLRLYATLEVAIGLYALGFPWILGGIEKIYASIYPSIYENFTLIVLMRASISSVILLPPTVLMGGTLPILTKHFVRKLALVGQQTGLIYGLNTIGAALGSFLTGYLLLPTLGVSKTNVLAGLINLILGLAMLAISRQTELTDVSRVEDKTRKEPEKVEIEHQHSGIIPLTIACFGVSGFVSMAYEVIWPRYSLFFFRDTSYLYTGIITIFILGIGVGSLVCRLIINRIRSTIALFGFLQVGIGLSTILAIYLPIPWYQTICEAGEMSSGNVLLFLFILLIIPAIFMGATFPVVTEIITTKLHTVGRQVGRAYALNTVGCICGSLAAGFFFFPVIGLQATLYLLFGLNMIMATVLIAAERWPIRLRLFMAIIPFSLCVLFPVFLQYGFDYQLPELIVYKISNKEEVLEIDEGITGTTWAVRSMYSGAVMLLENRVIISRDNSASFLIQGYIPLLLTPKVPRNVLGLCFGGGLSYYAGRLFPEIEQFDFVDISKKNMDIAIRHFPENEGLKDDPRARFIVDDAYNFLKYSGNKYDLILMDPTPPTFSFRCATLYTREFYELARKRLSEGGYFAQVVPLKHMSYLESMSVMKTFASVFKNCLLWWNGFEPVMIGSNQEFHLNIREIRERLNRPLVQSSLKRISGEIEYNYLGHFLSGLLLTTEDFRKVAEIGTVYTNDLNRLEFSSGHYANNLDSVIRIYTHLSPWMEAKEIFFGMDLEKYTQQLTARREYLMTILQKFDRN